MCYQSTLSDFCNVNEAYHTQLCKTQAGLAADCAALLGFTEGGLSGRVGRTEQHKPAVIKAKRCPSNSSWLHAGTEVGMCLTFKNLKSQAFKRALGKSMFRDLEEENVFLAWWQRSEVKSHWQTEHKESELNSKYKMSHCVELINDIKVNIESKLTKCHHIKLENGLWMAICIFVNMSIYL